MRIFAGIELRTLGGFSLESETRSLDFAYEKGRALLVFLAMKPGCAHSRISLATMFWPELERAAALTNLRQVLHDLRQIFSRTSLSESPLQVDRESVRLHPAFGSSIDAVELVDYSHVCPVSPFRTHCKLCCEQMERIVERYSGEFMRGFALPECPDFEDWMQVQREALHLRMLAMLSRLADCHERMGAYARALYAAQHFLELEPWSEEGLRRVMRLHWVNGQAESALMCYQTGILTLKRELGVSPAIETRMLAEHIERRHLSVDVSSDSGKSGALASPVAVSERRQVTALFCELSFPGVEDPDDILSLAAAPQSRCIKIIGEHSGHLAQTSGGGLLAYFGFPLATENAARQAVTAALALAANRFPGLELRVGIHSGVVISGSVQVPDAIGVTSGLAIRMPQVADKGQVVISGMTLRLVDGYFECQNMGLRQLQGTLRPFEVFRVLRASGACDRVGAETVLTPLVGRQREISRLLSLWSDTRRGLGRVVLLSGEAGVGKSRLVLTLKQALRDESCTIHELRCLPERSHSPFYPLLDLFGKVFDFLPEDTPAQKFDKLAAYVKTHYSDRGELAVSLYAKMLSLALRLPYRDPELTPQQQREEMFGLLLDRQEALAKDRRYLLIAEDLQWADPSTLELLHLIVARNPDVPILAVFTARSGFQPPWGETQTVPISLEALSPSETARLISSIASSIEPAMVERLVERADGIPLFAEELARELSCGERNAIPPTLLDLLLSRLDSMGTAKIVAQAAATIGREFTIDLLERIIPCDFNCLERVLERLLQASLLNYGLKDVYRFKHALIRDAAYESQTRHEREVMHRRIASALSALGTDARPELLALHWAAGGEILKATASWIEAGKQASREFANQEAMAHFRAGLASAEKLPNGPERERLELELYVGLGAASSSARGYAALEGVEFYERAMSSSGLDDSDSVVFPAIWRLWASASSRAGYTCANDLARHLLRMAEYSGDPIQLQQGRFALANTLYWQGQFVTAREHLEAVRSTYRIAHHDSHVAVFGEDVGVTAESYYSWVMWFLGFPDHAQMASDRALQLSRQLGHPFSLAYALTFAAILRCRQGMPREAQALAKETLELSRKHGFGLWEIGAQLTQGWAQAMEGDAQGVELIHQCVDSTRLAMGGVTLVVLSPLADALVKLRRFKEALTVCGEALAIAERLGDGHIEAELHRLSGLALLGADASRGGEAENSFRMALTISDRQQARLMQLRAAVNLSDLWCNQGRPDDARAVLGNVYRQFCEGFDVPDLKSARVLLDTLEG